MRKHREILWFYIERGRNVKILNILYIGYRLFGKSLNDLGYHTVH